MQLRRCTGARALLLGERQRHAGEVEYSVHLRVHRYGLAVPARAHLGAVVVRPVVVVAARDNLAAFDEDRTESEVDRAFLPVVDERSQRRNSKVCQTSNSRESGFGCGYACNASREDVCVRSMIQTGQKGRTVHNDHM